MNDAKSVLLVILFMGFLVAGCVLSFVALFHTTYHHFAWAWFGIAVGCIGIAFAFFLALGSIEPPDHRKL